MKSIDKNIAGIAFSILLSLTIGCKKSFLEVSPPSQIEESNFFKTELQANQALAGVYHVLQWGNINQGHTPLMGWAEAASDDAYAGGGSSSDAVGVKGIDSFRATAAAPFNANDGTYGSVWSIYFQGIARANTYLANVDRVQTSADFKNVSTAEAKFLRAHFYFDLFKWFENVPLIIEQQTPDQYNQPQAAPQAVLNQIAKDLTEAMVYLPKKSMKANNGHATYWSASALLARVYLYGKGVYGTELNAAGNTIDAVKIRSYLDEIISIGGFDLIQSYSDVWRKNNEMSIESVWEVDCSNLAYMSGSTSDQYRAQGNYNVLYFGPRGVNGIPYTAGFSNAVPTESLYQEFETAPNVDPRRDATILVLKSAADAPGLIKGWQHTGYFNNKYNTTTEYLSPSGLNSINWGQNIHVIRFSDVLLMAAELYIGVDQTKADAYLKRVRKRAGMPDRTATIDNIRHERRVELAGEGIRYWDLLRYGLPYAKQKINESSLIGPYYNGTLTTNGPVVFTAGANTPANGYAMDWDDSKRGHLPIPPTQVILSNGVLKQNPGY
ncbi:MAG: RagB/SusD family nutrient uptake outer membrane protein [Candidatus Pedobacter colombiensis]|uniref:RagB/SusD family nutrient uptake outer membrane protein n=1 Tax=Candidatus Pedobacter colombiensis TaxID=3121371 RepID=A0AAJ5W7M4_9SPHI|nr:RagB/SusD family nutrient uptake outer membrane protein [Pedobacter sp.]WEK18686.1 MAG: RagB/SusD family nutrient uptake outer membrane protein [Pedobacter sp.]